MYFILQLVFVNFRLLKMLRYLWLVFELVQLKENQGLMFCLKGMKYAFHFIKSLIPNTTAILACCCQFLFLSCTISWGMDHLHIPSYYHID